MNLAAKGIVPYTYFKARGFSKCTCVEFFDAQKTNITKFLYEGMHINADFFYLINKKHLFPTTSRVYSYMYNYAH